MSHCHYEVHAVSDENCNSIYPEVIFATDDWVEAASYAAAVSSLFAAAVVDTESGQVDYGRGFGVLKGAQR